MPDRSDHFRIIVGDQMPSEAAMKRFFQEVSLLCHKEKHHEIIIEKTKLKRQMSYIKSYEVKTVVPYEGDERIFFENDSKSALERFLIELLRNEIVNMSIRES
jgi:hypothetical protein